MVAQAFSLNFGVRGRKLSSSALASLHNGFKPAWASGDPVSTAKGLEVYN